MKTHHHSAISFYVNGTHTQPSNSRHTIYGVYTGSSDTYLFIRPGVSYIGTINDCHYFNHIVDENDSYSITRPKCLYGWSVVLVKHMTLADLIGRFISCDTLKDRIMVHLSTHYRATDNIHIRVWCGPSRDDCGGIMSHRTLFLYDGKRTIPPGTKYSLKDIPTLESSGLKYRLSIRTNTTDISPTHTIDLHVVDSGDSPKDLTGILRNIEKTPYSLFSKEEVNLFQGYVINELHRYMYFDEPALGKNVHGWLREAIVDLLLGNIQNRGFTYDSNTFDSLLPALTPITPLFNPDNNEDGFILDMNECRKCIEDLKKELIG